MPRPTTAETQRKIIQILALNDDIYGLSECGNVFILIEDGPRKEPEWEFVIDSPFLAYE